MTNKIFHICTISNDLEQYARMYNSFLEAGFTRERCTFSLFDNSSTNAYEPYAVFNKVVDETEEPYIIFCHQDILFDKGHGYDRLCLIIEDMDVIDPSWAILGNAGCPMDNCLAATVTASNEWNDDLPVRVQSLDENFLVIKRSVGLSCSKGLKGFHFYATDLCLQAMIQKQSCYVIDMQMTHLSGGNRDALFWKQRKVFQAYWSKHFYFCYINTPSTWFIFSRYKLLQFLLGRVRGTKMLLNKILRSHLKATSTYPLGWHTLVHTFVRGN